VGVEDGWKGMGMCEGESLKVWVDRGGRVLKRLDDWQMLADKVSVLPPRSIYRLLYIYPKTVVVLYYDVLVMIPL